MMYAKPLGWLVLRSLMMFTDLIEPNGEKTFLSMSSVECLGMPAMYKLHRLAYTSPVGESV